MKRQPALALLALGLLGCGPYTSDEPLVLGPPPELPAAPSAPGALTAPAPQGLSRGGPLGSDRAIQPRRTPIGSGHYAGFMLSGDRLVVGSASMRDNYPDNYQIHETEHFDVVGWVYDPATIDEERGWLLLGSQQGIQRLDDGSHLGIRLLHRDGQDLWNQSYVAVDGRLWAFATDHSGQELVWWRELEGPHYDDQYVMRRSLPFLPQSGVLNPISGDLEVAVESWVSLTGASARCSRYALAANGLVRCLSVGTEEQHWEVFLADWRLGRTINPESVYAEHLPSRTRFPIEGCTAAAPTASLFHPPRAVLGCQEGHLLWTPDGTADLPGGFAIRKDAEQQQSQGQVIVPSISSETPRWLDLRSGSVWSSDVGLIAPGGQQIAPRSVLAEPIGEDRYALRLADFDEGVLYELQTALRCPGGLRDLGRSETLQAVGCLSANSSYNELTGRTSYTLSEAVIVELASGDRLVASGFVPELLTDSGALVLSRRLDDRTEPWTTVSEFSLWP